MREVMKKTYIKPAVCILDADGSLLLVDSFNENPESHHSDNWHNGARGGGDLFDEEDYGNDDSLGW